MGDELCSQILFLASIKEKKCLFFNISEFLNMNRITLSSGHELKSVSGSVETEEVQNPLVC